MHRRIVSHKNIMKIIRNAKDFYIRSNDLMIMRISCIILALMGLSALAIQASMGIINADVSKFTLDNLATSAMVINSIVAGVAFIVLALIFRMYKLIIVSQFQSLLFSSAMRNDLLLCIITDSEGNIIYIDDNGYQIINEGKKNRKTHLLSLDELFEKGRIDTYNQDQFRSSINAQESFSMQHQLITPNKELKNVITKVEPITRPSGFCIIKSVITNSNSSAT